MKNKNTTAIADALTATGIQLKRKNKIPYGYFCYVTFTIIGTAILDTEGEEHLKHYFAEIIKNRKDK